MKREEAFKLTPEISYVMYAEGKYRVAYVAEEFGVTWIGIYDEPPSLHVDRIQAAHCSLHPAGGAEKVQWSGYGELGNISQKPPSPSSATAEEILQKYMDMSMIICPLHVVPRTVALDAMHEFAALQNNPQPTAEGAEEIIESIVESLGDPIYIHNHVFEIRPYTVEHKTEWWIFHKEVGSGEPLAQWLNKFATLHAQKIADKMVSERLRGKFLLAYDELRDLCCRFFRHWWNSPGANTEEGFDTWAEMNNLKSRDNDSKS